MGRMRPVARLPTFRFGNLICFTVRPGSARSRHSLTSTHFFPNEKMSLWVRLLVVVPFLIFMGVALLMMINGETKAALGALVVAGLIFPLLVEVFWPGKYALRKPDGEVEDNLVNRLKQFRVDYPGRDGTLLLGVFALIGMGILAGGIVHLVRLSNI
jgi:hypothetical protein